MTSVSPSADRSDNVSTLVISRRPKPEEGDRAGHMWNVEGVGKDPTQDHECEDTGCDPLITGKWPQSSPVPFLPPQEHLELR